jgi:hypothetical protein
MFFLNIYPVIMNSLESAVVADEFVNRRSMLNYGKQIKILIGHKVVGVQKTVVFIKPCSLRKSYFYEPQEEDY